MRDAWESSQDPSPEIGRRFYLDLHSHSTDASDDAGGTVEGYLKWIVARRKRGFLIDGFVLTEHRSFDFDLDYSEIAEQYGVTVLRGAELETDVGHVLVYGVTPQLAREFDFANIALPYLDLFKRAKELGGFAVGAHAGRPRIGLAPHVDDGASLEGVEVIEQLNGGSSDEENERGRKLAEARGLRCVGGSDAHYVSAIGRCLTAFPKPVLTEQALVSALMAGDYYPIRVEDTVTDAAPAAASSGKQ